MLNHVRVLGQRYPNDIELQATPDGGDLINVDRVLAAIRRQWKIVAICGAIGLLLGTSYALTAVPRYTAYTNLLIDSSRSRLLEEISSTPAQLEDETAILSQLEILRSRKISEAVAEKLDLSNNSTFMAPDASVASKFRGLLRSFFKVSSWFSANDDEMKSPAELKRIAAETLQSNVGVARVGMSSVLGISYVSTDPVLSAQIADGFAEAYLTDQLDAKYESTRRASSWLQERIEELRQQSIQSDQAVQAFRTKNNLIVVDGQLVSDQQLTELNSQFISAQNEVAQTRARFERIKSLVNSGDTNAVVSDSLGSSLVTAIRTRYLDTAKREAEISSRLGEQHQQAVRLRAEMDQYRRQMFDELSRLADSYQSDYQVAMAREETLRQSVQTATGVNTNAGRLQVELRELEREADTYRNLYQTFLQRYQEAIQQQSFPVTGARIISNAQPPLQPSYPRKTLLAALALVLGCSAGAGLGVFREFRDRFFRTSSQVREDLGIECLGLVTEVAKVEIVRPSAAQLALLDAQRLIARTSSVTRYVVDHPISSFAETLRNAKIAADLSIQVSRGKIIGVVSVLPSEGKSTISANMAALLSIQGGRTLLLDGDLRRPGLTRALAPHAKCGLVEYVLGDAALDHVIYRDIDTSLSFVPAVLRNRIPHTSELLASPAMSQFLKDASHRFDYIVVDLPPINAVVDVRAFASRVDGFIFVVEWGGTARRVVRSALEANPVIAEKCLGVILNKVDSNKLRLYREFGSNEFYSDRYEPYYGEAAT